MHSQFKNKKNRLYSCIHNQVKKLDLRGSKLHGHVRMMRSGNQSCCRDHQKAKMLQIQITF